ncbi:MAG: hypothetical protein H6Q69_3138 [Firmicutes bacterium]|nr:hypothetical protein [Bacillota bacterium]
MKKTLILMIALFILTMFATVSAHGNQDNLLDSNHRIVAVDGPDGPHDPPPPHKRKHPPEPPHDPPPGPRDPHDPHGPY